MKIINIKKGFTLVELIIVITLIAALVLIGITYLRSQIFKGNDARRKADIRRIQVAVEEYEKDHDCYPITSQIVCTPGTALKPYLEKVPCDSVTGASYYYEHDNSACSSWYKMYGVLENKNDVSVRNGIGPYGAFNYEAGSQNAPASSLVNATPPPSGGPIIPVTGYYGCKNGQCVTIGWDTSLPGPECSPWYQNPTCYGCGPNDYCTPQH